MTKVFLKIKYGETLRRITLGSPTAANECMEFRNFKEIVRGAFNIPAATGFDIVYTDNENEQVTMGDDDDIKDAFFYQALSPVRAIVVPQGEPQFSAQDACPPKQLTSDPPPWAADIIMKLDKLLLLAVNKQLMMERGVEPGRSSSTKTEEQLVGVDVLRFMIQELKGIKG